MSSQSPTSPDLTNALRQTEEKPLGAIRASQAELISAFQHPLLADAATHESSSLSFASYLERLLAVREPKTTER